MPIQKEKQISHKGKGFHDNYEPLGKPWKAPIELHIWLKFDHQFLLIHCILML